MYIYNILQLSSKYSISLIRCLSVCSRATQFETAKMSNLKTTHLNDISKYIFDLYQSEVKTEEVVFLSEIFQKQGFEIRLAGGGVRDLLCQIAPHDIDFATDAKPDQMISLLSGIPNIRLITTLAGQRHGTVTARINNKVQYEITTLRIDAKTDGRHAEVQFINDWKLDSSRRDLTINSMFIDMNGVLYDYFDGESDLKNRIIRFVGDPEKRLKEDYLRIFRYFRFHTRFGLSGNHDPNTLNIIKNNLDGLQTISGERIWTEMKRILTNINCTNSIETMFQVLNIGKHLGFTAENFDLKEFYEVQKRLSLLNENNRELYKPHTLFSALIEDVDELSSILVRLKLSNYERDTINYILGNRNSAYNVYLLKSQLALAHNPSQSNLRDFMIQFLIYMGAPEEMMQELQEWTIPKFPFNGTMVANRINKKKQIGLLLNELKAIWAKNNFQMSESQMQIEVDRIIDKFNK